MSTLVFRDVLRQRAEESPDKLFLWCGDEKYTFGQMEELSDRIAAGLAQRGVGKGDRVAFVSTNRSEMLELMFGCAKLGAVQVPLNAYLRGEFLRYQLEDSGASTLIVDRGGLEASLPVLGKLPHLQRIVNLDDVEADSSSVADVFSYKEVRESAGAAPSTDMGPRDLMDILYTSGTTGLPKGCMMTNGYYANVGGLMGDVWDLQSEDTFITALPLFHGGARILVVTAALVHGATVVLEPAFSPRSMLDRINETQATHLFGVGAMGAAMLSLPPSEGNTTDSLRFAAFVPFPPDLQQQFMDRFGAECHAELYAQTECVPATYSRPTGPRNRASAGQAAQHLEMRLVDDDDNEVPTGEVGEIALRPREPYSMYAGYWNKAEETVAAWRNLWHHTGDFGRLDEDGFLTFVDRKKDALRRRGENISSMELEMAIVQHPKILEAAVHAVPSDLLEDDVKVCVVLAEGETIEPGDFFQFLKENLPYYAVPRYVELMPELPKNAVARVMKHVLRGRGLTDQTWDLEELGFSISREERR